MTLRQRLAAHLTGGRIVKPRRPYRPVRGFRDTNGRPIGPRPFPGN